MKKIFCLIVSLVFVFTCGCSTDTKDNEIIVFAASSMTDVLYEASEKYSDENPDVNIVFNFDSSGTLKTQIEEGADCDIFISAAQKQMNELDKNTGGTDIIDSNTRSDLVSNTVVLIVPKGNPADIKSFEDVGSDKVSLIAVGNSDVPAGQYAEEVFTYMGIWEKINEEEKITFGTNAREVLAQTAEGAVECGVVYSTDAVSENNVEVVDTAPSGSHREVTYPAAILNNSGNFNEAKKFLDYLHSEECMEIFERAGFKTDL